MINKLNVVVSIFMTLLVGIVLLSVLANVISTNRTLDTQINETVTLTHAAGGNTGTTTQNDVVSIQYFANGSTDYSANISTAIDCINITKSTGAIIVDNKSISINGTGTFNLSYTYEGEMYVDDNRARTILFLIPIFFALVFLAIGMIFLNQMGMLGGKN